MLKFSVYLLLINLRIHMKSTLQF